MPRYPEGQVAVDPVPCDGTAMDPTPIAIGIVAINLGVFLAGCSLAAVRTWRESHPARRRQTPSPATVGRVSH